MFMTNDNLTPDDGGGLIIADEEIRYRVRVRTYVIVTRTLW